MNEQEVEQAVQDKGLNAPRIVPSQVDLEIDTIQYHVFENTTTTVCAIKLKNGYVVTGTSAAASVANFDQEIGRAVAFRNAREAIWPLLGFRLRDKLFAESQL